MKKIIDEIKTFFKNNNWKYEYNKEDNIFISGLDMGNVLGNVRMFILLEENSYNVYMILNSKSEGSNYPLIAEFLHRANYGLKDGNFEMDEEASDGTLQKIEQEGVTVYPNYYIE